MFVPGLGAFVRLRQRPANPIEDARIGLAGPIWGLGAAVVAYGAFLAVGWPILAAVARVGAWINLFNLLPVWQLDGGRAFNALSRPQRWIAAAGLTVAWIATHEGLLVLLALVAAARAWGKPAQETPEGVQGDRATLVQYLALVALLAALCLVDVPAMPGSGN
jgi:Zn-dependent protease